ncbi:MAG: tetratricopeptide repeat protein [Desulfobacteraceae bacterium]|nr:tetratricopeptide repeat protein [Desulfobacteraceae bacterium]
MKKEMKKEHTGMVPRQLLYMAVLVSVTIGFILGAAYTSFKLADESSPGRVQSNNGSVPQSSAPGSTARDTKTDARIMELEKFLVQNPDDAAAWATLGHLFFDNSQFDKAIHAYEKSLALEPENPGVITDMGVMYRRSGQPEKAIKAFDRAVAVSPNFETALFNKGVVLMADLNDLAGAMAAWEELVKINPDATTPNGEKVADLVDRMKQQN